MKKEKLRMDSLYIEEKLLNSVKKLLSGRVNELLEETELPIPSVEFGQSGFTGLSPKFRQSRNSTVFGSGDVVVPGVGLSSCERSEKERIVRAEAHTLTITFSVPEWPDGERNCYAYASSVARALKENPSLSGAVDRAELAGKKYTPPKQSGTGGDWEVELKIRVLLEEAGV
jgi:hypothetical protein